MGISFPDALKEQTWYHNGNVIHERRRGSIIPEGVDYECRRVPQTGYRVQVERLVHQLVNVG